MSNQLNTQDKEEAIDLAISLLNGTKDPIEDAVAEIVISPRNGRVDDEFTEMLSVTIEYVNAVMWEKNSDMFASDRDLEDALSICIRIACDTYALNHRMDDLYESDDAYDDAAVNAEKYDSMADAVNNMSRGGRGRGRGREPSRGRGRDSGRSGGRGRDSGRSGGRGREPSRDSRSSGRGRGRSNDVGRKAASAQYRDVEPQETGRSQKEAPRSTRTSSRRTRPHSNADSSRATRSAEVERDLGGLEAIKVSEISIDTVYDNEIFGLYINKSGEGQLVAHADATELGMEEYKIHEVKGSGALTARDKSIVPIADMRKMKDPATDDTLEPDEQPVVVYPETLKFSSPVVEIPTSELAPLTANGKDYQVARYEISSRLIMDGSLVTKLNAEVSDIVRARSFSDIHVWLESAIDYCTEVPDNNRFITYNTLKEFNNRLTELFNDALVIVGSDATIEDFHNDFHSAYNWLLSPEQTDRMSLWGEIESEHIKANCHMSYTDVAADIADSTVSIDIVAKVYGIRVNGSMANIVSTRNVSNTGRYKPSVLVYDKSAGFYNACLKLVAHRKTHMAMSPIIMCDGAGAQYKLFASNLQTPIMRLMKVK